jgi:hypothetical protein
MNTQANEALYLRLLFRGVAAVLLGTFGIVAVMAWAPTSTDMSGAIFALDKLRAPPAGPADAGAQIPPARAEGNAHVRITCAECGVVESTREIEELSEGVDPGAASKSAKSYEVTVRMKNGTSHVFVNAKPVNWRPGERMIVIEGVRRASN